MQEKHLDRILYYLRHFISKLDMLKLSIAFCRSSPPEVFTGKGVLKICSKFTREHPCRCVILIRLLCKFIEISLWHGSSPVNLLYIFRTPFVENTFGGLLLNLTANGNYSDVRG